MSSNQNHFIYLNATFAAANSASTYFFGKHVHKNRLLSGRGAAVSKQQIPRIFCIRVELQIAIMRVIHVFLQRSWVNDVFHSASVTNGVNAVNHGVVFKRFKLVYNSGLDEDVVRRSEISGCPERRQSDAARSQQGDMVKTMCMTLLNIPGFCKVHLLYKHI
jgi:hypothetical protein